MLGPRPELHVRDLPALGDQMLKLDAVPPSGTPPQVMDWPQVTARGVLGLQTEIRALHEEVAGLRYDLANRTLGARCRRAWAWLRELADAVWARLRDE